MDVEALELINGEHESAAELRRLIVAWPAVRDADDHERWGAVAGVAPSDVERHQHALFDLGFIGPDGLVDPDAAAFIRARVAAVLRRGQQRSRR